MRPKPSRVSAFRNCFGTIWPVSTLTRSSGATRPVWALKGCINSDPSERSNVERSNIETFLFNVGDVEFAHVNEMAGDSSSRRHDRADQMRSAVFALTALEIAIAGAGTAFVRRQNVRAHADARAAARVAPIQPRDARH